MKNRNRVYLIFFIIGSAVSLWRSAFDVEKPELNSGVEEPSQQATKKSNDYNAPPQVAVVKIPTTIKKSWLPSGNNSEVPLLNDRMLRKSRTTSQKTSSSARRPNSTKVSLKNKHINYIRAGKLIDRKTYVDQKLGPVSTSYYRVDKGQFKELAVTELLEPGSNKVRATYVEDARHILVRFDWDLSVSEIKEFMNEHSLPNKKALGLANSYSFTLDRFSIDYRRQLEQDLRDDPRVAYFDANSLNYASLVTPNDPLFEALWGLKNTGVDPVGNVPFQMAMDIQAEQAWDNLTDCSAAPVAVLDTGIDPNHPDLAANIQAGSGRDFSSAVQTDFIDRQGHGTHVAGTVGAVGNNSLGVTGVCWKASIIPVKVLNDQGVGSNQAIINALMYVTQTNAKVLNLSLGGGPFNQLVFDAIGQVTGAGKIFVAAAGNENNDNDQLPAYPASYVNPLIVSVAAHHGGGDIATFSNFGNAVHIAAPGQDIVSTYINPNGPEAAYAPLSGTSMASPHVAGVIALFWSYASELTAAQVRQTLFDTSKTMQFTKTIEGARMIDLNAVMDVIKAKATINQVAAPLKFSGQVGQNKYSLAITPQAGLAAISSIEIRYRDLILGRASGDAATIEIDLPLGFRQADLVAVVTDMQGRTYTSPVMPVTLDFERTTTFSNIDAARFSGSSNCELRKIGTDGSAEILYSNNVESQRVCQKLCDVMGPMVFSSLGEIQCAQGSEIIYQVVKN